MVVWLYKYDRLFLQRASPTHGMEREVEVEEQAQHGTPLVSCCVVLKSSQVLCCEGVAEFHWEPVN